MSLSYQFDKKKHEEMSEEDKAMNEAYIWGCMIIDMGEITEKNASEWHWRYNFAQKLIGYHYAKNELYFPSMEEVCKRIGLRTNVSTKTRNQFLAKMARLYKP